mmetsp:Transcript_26788/g.39631  ORF Transcript_26788/g.39631 Transcript_26788/m.39631 type:complete len:230 (-) Transcript_26788:51-740(-)|eukprot:CAMPEP_0194247696 /NCGR_PEP_ID=MMETSP0158-20130606/16964_1 /TAXON_ID=33649 /ORGANISM="Thalassionema nitzschioides, Strain L26-B" /LENGTH=229 /DNA_ID=CAMNT_0038983825 /DNA_START=138 /DNA_END=827 /DNA_ORIENTATION=+
MTIANNLLNHPNFLLGVHPEEITTSHEQYVKERDLRREERKVTFHEIVAVRPIEHIGDMNAEDVYNIWYRGTDFNSFKRSFLNTIQMMLLGNYNGDDLNNCARGLECRTRDGAYKRKMNKYHSRQAVLSEQDRQTSIGIRNEHMISDVYTMETISARLEALELGIQDQNEVFEEVRKIKNFEMEVIALDVMTEEMSSDEEIDYCDEGGATQIFSDRRGAENSVTDELRE